MPAPGVVAANLLQQRLHERRAGREAFARFLHQCASDNRLIRVRKRLEVRRFGGML
jgi:hypothetical protein